MRGLRGLAVVAGVLALVPIAAGQAAEPDPCASRPDALFENEALCDVADQLGLLDSLGDNAEVALLAAGALLGSGLLWLLVSGLVRVWPRRYLRISAEERVAEIDAGETARFTVNVENRLRRRPLGVVIQAGDPPAGWVTRVTMERPTESGFLEVFHGVTEGVTLHGRKSPGRNVLSALVEVEAPPGASHEEWAELAVTAVPYRRGEPRPRKAKSVPLITLLREHAAKVAIADVKHDPPEFQPGHAVTSTVTLTNNGNEPARELPVVFALNDADLETKRVNVGAGETRGVDFRWTAQPGPNQVRITLGEPEPVEEPTPAPA